MNIILIFFSIKYNGDWDKIYNALETKERVSLEEIKKTEELIKDKKVLTILDQDYPMVLKEAYKPPFVIWYKGDKSLLKSKMITTTGNGTDKATLKRILTNTSKFEDKFTLVTQSLQGVDKEVLKQRTKPVIFVSASSLDKTSVDFRDGDLIMTELPDGAKTTKETLRSTNRLVAAASNSLVLYSSDMNGPLNNLVSSFLNLGKEVYVFPGNGDDNDGNSELIKQGATLITKAEEVK